MTITTPRGDLPAYVATPPGDVATPPGDGPCPGVVVIHDAWGLGVVLRHSQRVSGVPLGGIASANPNCGRRSSDRGGWSDIDSMESSGFATGKALVALQTAGLSVSDAAYERGGPVSAENATGGRLVVRQDARDGAPAVFRCRLPPRFRSVDFRRGSKLGDHDALAGVPGAPGADDGGIAGAIGDERNGSRFNPLVPLMSSKNQAHLPSRSHTNRTTP